jgi:hypothetical protein
MLPLRTVLDLLHCIYQNKAVFRGGLYGSTSSEIRSYEDLIKGKYLSLRHKLISIRNNIKKCYTINLVLYKCILDSSVGIATRLRDGQSGFLGLIPGGGWEFFLFTTASRTVVGPTQPPIQWVPGVLSLGIKRPGREADHSPLSRTECVELYIHSPILHGVVLS